MHRLGLCVLALAACDGALTPCEAREIRDCDIHQLDCQESHNELLRCVRGDDQPSVELEFLDPDAYRARYGDSPSELDPLVLRGLSLLELASVPPVPFGLAGVPAAIYDPDRAHVIVVDDEDTQATLAAIAQAHADAALGGYFKTQAPQRTSLADALVGLAVHVGEGVFYGDAAYFKTEAMDAAAFHEHLRANLYYDDTLLDALAVARERKLDHGPLGGAFAGAYGPRLLLAIWLADGASGVRALYEPGAVSTAELMRGALDGAAPSQLGDTLPELPADLEYVAHDSLGPWFMHAFQVRADPPPAGTPLQDDLTRSLAIADAWADDRLAFIHDTATDQVAVWWRISLVAGAELPVQPGHEGAWSTVPGPDRLDIVGADTPELRDRVLAAL